MRVAIFGLGGFAREIRAHLNGRIQPVMVSDRLNNIEYNTPTILALGDPFLRYDIAHRYALEWYGMADSSQILDPSTVDIGLGSVVCRGAVLTTDIKIGCFNHINLNATIGHDVTTKDFVTIAPGVNVSGGCTIGNRVTIGTNAALKEGVRVCDDVIIGMNSCVVKDITKPGIYVGNPIKKL